MITFQEERRNLKHEQLQLKVWRKDSMENQVTPSWVETVHRKNIEDDYLQTCHSRTPMNPRLPLKGKTKTHQTSMTGTQNHQTQRNVHWILLDLELHVGLAPLVPPGFKENYQWRRLRQHKGKGLHHFTTEPHWWKFWRFLVGLWCLLNIKPASSPLPEFQNI